MTFPITNTRVCSHQMSSDPLCPLPPPHQHNPPGIRKIMSRAAPLINTCVYACACMCFMLSVVMVHQQNLCMIPLVLFNHPCDSTLWQFVFIAKKVTFILSTIQFYIIYFIKSDNFRHLEKVIKKDYKIIILTTILVTVHVVPPYKSHQSKYV